MKELTVTKNESGIRLNKYLGKMFPNIPMSMIYKLLRKKTFELNGKKAKGLEILKDGDKIFVFLSDDTYKKWTDKNTHIEKADRQKIDYISHIVYEDKNIIVFDKPKGMLSQSDKSNDISVNNLLRNDNDLFYKPSIVNRLDRNTRGLIIFAKTYQASKEISEMIRDGNISKYYIAKVNGILKENEKILTNLYKKDEEHNKAIIYDIDTNKSDDKSIVKLKYKVLDKNLVDDYTTIDIELFTGKSHQIRAQLSFIGHPLLGDKKYMDKILYDSNVRKFNINTQELICYKIKFGKFKNEDLKYLDDKEFFIKEEIWKEK